MSVRIVPLSDLERIRFVCQRCEGAFELPFNQLDRLLKIFDNACPLCSKSLTLDSDGTPGSQPVNLRSAVSALFTGKGIWLDELKSLAALVRVELVIKAAENPE